MQLARRYVIPDRHWVQTPKLLVPIMHAGGPTARGKASARSTTGGCDRAAPRGLSIEPREGQQDYAGAGVANNVTEAFCSVLGLVIHHRGYEDGEDHEVYHTGSQASRPRVDRSHCKLYAQAFRGSCDVCERRAMYASDRGAMYANDRVRCMRTTGCDLCKRQEPRRQRTATNGGLYSTTWRTSNKPLQCMINNDYSNTSDPSFHHLCRRISSFPLAFISTGLRPHIWVSEC